MLQPGRAANHHRKHLADDFLGRTLEEMVFDTTAASPQSLSFAVNLFPKALKSCHEIRCLASTVGLSKQSRRKGTAVLACYKLPALRKFEERPQHYFVPLKYLSVGKLIESFEGHLCSRMQLNSV